MHKINKTKIEGFRRLRKVEMEMRPLMVMIGANGVGKSSFLDAISLLSASAAGKMNDTLSGMGGIADVLTRGYSGDLVMEASMDIPNRQPLEYSLHIKPVGQAYNIAQELLSQSREGFDKPFRHIESRYSDVKYYDIDTGKLSRPTWEHDHLETSLSQVPKMFREPEELRKVLGSATQYHVLDVSRRSPVKLPQQMKPAYLPGVDGEDLVPFLYYLRESNRDRYDAIEDTLKSAFPGFESLNFPPVAAGMLSMTWKEKHFRSPLYMHQLSEGTLRFIWLISLLQSPNLSTITMIDEPEVSLHPEMLSLLADLMREASQRTQVIVATHSDRLIRFLEPKEVVVMDIGNDGFATARWADTLNLDEWLKEYSLDEVWRMGRMGGRS
ncbi:MAG: AAA family ATPase [Deltaproteobacteria bacterium]|nr:AAA family ATPase [Deltaproteobacteria bacterium]